MPEKDSWSARFTRSVAEQIHRHRKARGWSAQKLSDACTKLGMEFPRSTLADLESGRRAHISVAELIVIAHALNVPPLQLIFPVGCSAESEVLPGQPQPAFQSAQWFTGEGPFPGGDYSYTRGTWFYIAGSQGTPRPLALYRAYSVAAREEMLAIKRARGMDADAADTADDSQRGDYAAAAAASWKAAESHRANMEKLRRDAVRVGMLPPGTRPEVGQDPATTLGGGA